ncbi:hypothetical protein G9A89_004473 [Geosiphon pyriformis]|nr:hypothetical protein G9A89_004473 [Geosiphon pyriformis]
MGCAYIGFDSKASHHNATNKPLVIGDTLVYWVPTNAKECHFCYQIRHLVSNCPTLLKKKERNTKKATNNIWLAKLYVKKNVPKEHIKAFEGRSYAEMVALNPSNNRYNANPSGSQKAGLHVNNQEGQQKKGTNQPWRFEIDKLRQQVNEMAKLLNAVALKLGVTVEKKDEGKVVNQPPSHISEKKKEGNNKKAKQYMSSKHTLEEKKEAYNPEKKINDIKKALEPIIILLKQVEKQSNWNGATAGESKSMETDDGKISVHIVGLYMPVLKSPTKKAVAKEIRKLLADIVQNKEIVLVAGDLNEDLAVKSLEKTIATNKEKKCPIATLLQQMNLMNIHGMYVVNNPDNTWASNGVQKRLDYVFTDVITALLVTNIGVININELFNTDYKAVVMIIQSDRILAGTKKFKSGRKKYKAQRKLIDNNNDDLNQMWLTIKETVLQAAECLPKKKKECMDHKLVKIVADIIKQIRVNNADMHNNNVMQLLAKWKQLKPETVNAYLMTLPKDKLIIELLSIKKEYRSTLHARIRLQQQRQIVNNIIKRQQNFELSKESMIKSILNRKRQRIVLDHVIEEGKFHDDPDEIKKLINKKAQRWTRTRIFEPELWKSWKHRFRPIESIPDHAFDGVMAEIIIEKFEHTLSHTPYNKALGPSGIQAELWRKSGPNTKSKLRTLLNACLRSGE